MNQQQHNTSQGRNKLAEHHRKSSTMFHQNRYLMLMFILLASMLVVIPGVLSCVPLGDMSSIYDSGSGSESSSENSALMHTRAISPAVTVDFTPKEPIHHDTVNVTIESKYGHEIINGELYIEFKLGEDTWGGVYIFHRINETIWYAEIPGYQNQGNTHAEFYNLILFDREPEPIRTKEFVYTVEYLGTWVSDSFAENINLSYSPAQPIAGEKVNITIYSNSTQIPIAHAILRVQVKFPGNYPVQEGGENFTRVNSTEWYAELPAYPGGTEVTFWVEVYDVGMSRINSDKYDYIVTNPLSEGMPQSIYIYAYDNAKKDFIEATVTIWNDTWKYENTTEIGVLWSPTVLNPGVYKIKVKYGSHSEMLKTIEIPTEGQDYTEIWFRFNIAESKGLVMDYDEFPQWFLNASIIIIILLCPIFYYFFTELQRSEKQKEQEQKDRLEAARKGKDTASLIKARLRKTSKNNAKPAATTTGADSQEGSSEFWYPGMIYHKIIADVEFKLKTVKLMGFFLLALFGATWAPFYPWWMVLVIAITVAAISYRFSFLAILILIMFVIASTAYQFPAFGWLFMIFALVITVCSLFDWRFGFLVFFTLFVSRLGFAFMVPMLTGMLISMFLGIVVAIASGIFFTFIVTSGDLTILSFFIGPTHKYGLITFSKPVVSDFAPTHIIDAFFSLSEVNLDSLITILHSNYSSMLPFIQIIFWVLAVFAFVYLFQNFAKEDINRSMMLSLIPSAILISSGVGSILIYDQPISDGAWLLFLSIIGVMLFVVIFAFTNMLFFKEFYLGKTREMPIGTRIGDMLSLRKTTFHEIGGLKEIKQELKDTMIGPLLRPEKAKEYGVEPPRGIMLFGPPGCGKTLLMRALATDLNVEMVGVRCSDVMSKWYGESEGMIEKLFTAVKELKPCILFLDEIDAIAKRRDFYSADDVTPRLLSIMLSELDGMDEAAGVIVVGATNKPELVDPALMRPGRFDKIIFIPAPGYFSRIEIFKIHLQGKPVSKQLDIKHLARGTDGFTGADIENIVKEAAMLAMKRSIKTGKSTHITNTDFLKILPRIKPSMSKDMKEEYDQLQKDFERKKYGKEIMLPPTEAQGGEISEDFEHKLEARAEPVRRPAVTKPKIRKKRAREREKITRKVTAARAPERKKKGKKPPKWKDIVGLDTSKRFFKDTIRNNILGGK